jgi:hypothetical protein
MHFVGSTAYHRPRRMESLNEAAPAQRPNLDFQFTNLTLRGPFPEIPCLRGCESEKTASRACEASTDQIESRRRLERADSSIAPAKDKATSRRYRTPEKSQPRKEVYLSLKKLTNPAAVAMRATAAPLHSRKISLYHEPFPTLRPFNPSGYLCGLLGWPLLLGQTALRNTGSPFLPRP